MSKKLYRVAAFMLAVCMTVLAFPAILACGQKNKKEAEILTVRDIMLDTTNAKTEFSYGEEFSADGLKVTAILSDASEMDVPLEKCRLSKVRNTPGKRKVSVTYAKKTKRYEVVFADKPMPPISDEAILEIEGVKTNGAYRVQAEDIDLAVSGVAANGGDLVVENADADGGKYIANYGNTDNYFGFTFTSDADYNNVTLSLRLADPLTDRVMQPGSNLIIYLNYAGSSDNGSLGITGSAAIAEASSDRLNWQDLVVRGLNIKEGKNTLTFGVLDEVVPCIDYIDFYVGKHYSTSSMDLAATGERAVKQIEDMGIEKMTTREDYLKAYDLEQGEICVLDHAAANGGKAAFAIMQGEATTLINAASDSTVQLIMSAASGADWRFSKDAEILLDGESINVKEHNIRAGDPEKGEIVWQDTNLGIFDLAAGEHILDVKINSPHANFDALTVKTLSMGGFLEEHPDVYIDGTGTFVMEGEHLDPSGVVVRDDYAELVIGQKYGAYNTVNYANASGRRAIDGFTGKYSEATPEEVTVFTFDFYLSKDATVDINAVAASQLGVNFMYRNQVVVSIDGVVNSPARVNLAEHWNNETSKFDDVMWLDTRLAHRNLTAGMHTFKIEVRAFYFILDCFKLKVYSSGEYLPDVTINGTGEYYAEAETLDPRGVIARADYITAGRIISERDEYFVDADADPHGGGNISGLAQGSTLTSLFKLNDKARVRIYIGAKTAYNLGVRIDNKTHVLFSVDGKTPKRPPEQDALNANIIKENATGWVDREIGLWTLDEGMHTFKIDMVGFPIELDYIRYEVLAYGADADVDLVIDGVGSFKMEAEDIDPTGAVAKSDFLAANRIYNATNEFCISADGLDGSYSVCGLAAGANDTTNPDDKYPGGTKLSFDFELKDAAALRIYICAKGAGTCLYKNNLSAAGDAPHFNFFIDDDLLSPRAENNVLTAAFKEHELAEFIRLDAGKHTLDIELRHYAMDIDYFRFEVIGYGTDPDGMLHDITLDGKTEQTFEAEWIDDCDVKMQTGFSATQGYKFPVGTAPSSTVSGTTSNNKYINGFTTGNVLRINFDLEEATAFKIVVNAKANLAVCIWKHEELEGNNNHVNIFLDNDRIIPPNRSGSNPTDMNGNDSGKGWVPSTITDSIRLEAGSHTLEIRMVMAFDIDCFTFIPVASA